MTSEPVEVRIYSDGLVQQVKELSFRQHIAVSPMQRGLAFTHEQLAARDEEMFNAGRESNSGKIIVLSDTGFKWADFADYQKGRAK